MMPPLTTAVAMPATMREGIVTINILRLLLLSFFLKKMNWPLYRFGSPMSTAAACTCRIWQVGMLIATELGSPGCGIFLFSSLAGGGGSFFSSSGGGSGNAKTALTVPVSRSFLC
jgi:hypothetical protein